MHVFLLHFPFFRKGKTSTHNSGWCLFRSPLASLLVLLASAATTLAPLHTPWPEGITLDLHSLDETPSYRQPCLVRQDCPLPSCIQISQQDVASAQPCYAVLLTGCTHPQHHQIHHQTLAGRHDARWAKDSVRLHPVSAPSRNPLAQAPPSGRTAHAKQHHTLSLALHRHPFDGFCFPHTFIPGNLCNTSPWHENFEKRISPTKRAKGDGGLSTRPHI